MSLKKKSGATRSSKKKKRVALYEHAICLYGTKRFREIPNELNLANPIKKIMKRKAQILLMLCTFWTMSFDWWDFGW